MAPPATLDGGDVLRVGSVLYVSPSSRTNAAGIAVLRETFPRHRVCVLPLPEGVLHLKCVCSAPAPDLVVVAEGPLVEAFAEHQRVLIARALAQEAGILLFDEPTASLDPEHQVQVFDLIRRLVEGGRASLVATHELSLASRYADPILLFDGGKIRAQGTPGEVLRPEVLEPAFGGQLVFAPSGDASGRSLVVPWPRES